MHRAFYLAGWGWVALAISLLARGPVTAEPFVGIDPGVTFAGSDAYAWFQRVRPSCNALEAQTRLQREPPPGNPEGAGFGAACLALAGRIDGARALIDALPEADRAGAAGIVFGVGHPVADMGDDASAGPIMRLVVAYTPWNYMALYHAGMSYYELGDPALAREHLERFMNAYPVEDGWRSNAGLVLKRLDAEATR